MDDINKYFEILGLKPGASLAEVKEAYKDLVKVWHPDRYGHDPKLQAKVQEKLKEINGAYQKVQDFLNNPYQYQQATGTSSNKSDETKESAKTETKESSKTNEKEDMSSSQPPPFERSGEKRGRKKSRNIAAWIIGLFIVLVIFKVLTEKQSSPIDDCILKYQKEAKSKQASVIINSACRGNYSDTVKDCILKNIGDAQTDMAANSIRRSCQNKYKELTDYEKAIKAGGVDTTSAPAPAEKRSEIPVAPGTIADTDSVKSGSFMKEIESINDPEKLAQLGDKYFDNNRYPEAIEAYEKALKLNPKDVDTYNDLGLALHYTGRPEKAIEILRKGTEVNPSFQRVWLSLGFILTATGKSEEAKTALNKVVDLDPNSTQGQEAKRLLGLIKTH